MSSDTKFSWDENKRTQNLLKHGIDFRDCVAVFAGILVTTPDERYEYGERRFQSLGLIRENTVLLVHTEGAHEIRIISARKATRQEREYYFRAIREH